MQDDEGKHFLIIRLGEDTLPFFAEYPYFLWGEVNYDSEGDCEKPTDRNWNFLYLAHRAEKDEIEISNQPKGIESRMYQVAGEKLQLVRLAAYLTALRTGGSILEPESSREMKVSEFVGLLDRPDDRLTLAEQVRAMFLNPALIPFDSKAWWGGWKWCGYFGTKFTIGLRLTMQAVIEGKADREMIDWLLEWWNEPPLSSHREGVRYAIATLTGKDPEPVSEA